METNIEQAVDNILKLFLEKKQSENLLTLLKNLGCQICALKETGDREINALCNLWEAAALLPTDQQDLVKNTLAKNILAKLQGIFSVRFKKRANFNF